MLDVSDLADRCAAGYGNETHFAAGHFERCVSALFRHELRGDSRRARDLAAPARLEFDVVYHRTDGDVFERKAVACLDIGIRAAHDRIAHVQAHGREDISLFAVGINEQRDIGTAVGVILDAFDLCGNIVFISLEIDDAVFSSVAAADMAHGDLARIVAAAALAHIFDEASFRLGFRDLFVGMHRHETARRGCRFISLDCHFPNSSDKLRLRQRAEILDRLAVRFQLNDGFFIGGSEAFVPAHSL